MARYQTDFYAKSLARRVTMSLIVPSLNLNETLSNKDKEYWLKQLEEFEADTGEQVKLEQD